MSFCRIELMLFVCLCLGLWQILLVLTIWLWQLQFVWLAWLMMHVPVSWVSHCRSPLPQRTNEIELLGGKSCIMNYHVHSCSFIFYLMNFNRRGFILFESLRVLLMFFLMTQLVMSWKPQLKPDGQQNHQLAGEAIGGVDLQTWGNGWGAACTSMAAKLYHLISFPDLVDVVWRSLCEFDVNIVQVEDYDNNVM